MKRKEVSESIPPHIKTANEFVNVKDIKGNFLCTAISVQSGFVIQRRTLYKNTSINIIL